MGMTQKDVINELAHYDMTVTPRRLTDWRQRGLLPELEEVRDARGHVAYVWNQANIVDQVAEVWALFANYGHASPFAHMLWLLGYEVRPDLVMECIRAPIVSYWDFWSGGAPTDEQLFDDEQEELLLGRISDLASTISRRRDRRPEGYPTLKEAAYHVYQGFSAMMDPIAPAEDVINDIMAQSKSDAPWDVIPDPGLIEIVEFAQRHFTPRHLTEVASNATWQEYCEAGEDFRILREIVALFDLPERLRSQMVGPDPRMLMVVRNGALGRLGPWIIIGDIAFRRAGHGQRIREHLSQVREWLSETDLSAFDKEAAQYMRLYGTEGN